MTVNEFVRRAAEVFNPSDDDKALLRLVEDIGVPPLRVADLYRKKERRNGDGHCRDALPKRSDRYFFAVTACS